MRSEEKKESEASKAKIIKSHTESGINYLLNKNKDKDKDEN